jgi:hypothetical protein
MPSIRTYQELRVYQSAMDAAMRIFELQSKLSSCGEILYGRSDEALFAISMHEHRRGLA